MTRNEILEIQRQLGLKQDGIYGPKTAAAYQRWLDANTVESMPTPAPVAAKPWWTSKTVIFTLATIGVSIAGLLGVDLDKSLLTETITAAITLVTGVLALWANARRTAPIDNTLIAPGVRLAARTHPVPPTSTPNSTSNTGPFGY